MKRVFVLVSLVVAILVIGRNAFAHIPEPSLSSKWKLVARGSGWSPVYVDTRRITHLPGGIVKVWYLFVLRGELRRDQVNFLKKQLLLKGEDPNNAERLWYEIDLVKFNCKTHQFAPLEEIDYSFGKAVLYSYSYPYEKWHNNVPGSVGEKIENYVCEASPSIPAQYKQNIPEPSLSSKWKLLSRNLDGSTLYINTRNTTHLPGGVVKVWTLYVLRGKDRRTIVNTLKKVLFFKGKDPIDAERFWYFIELDKFNCKTHQFATLEDINYSFRREVLDDESYQHKKWEDIVPGSAEDIVEKYVCK